MSAWPFHACMASFSCMDDVSVSCMHGFVVMHACCFMCHVCLCPSHACMVTLKKQNMKLGNM